MFRNYLKIAVRNLLKNGFYSVINILGFALGISCFLFIAIYVQDELSYDRYNTHLSQIHRVDFRAKLGDTEVEVPQVGIPVGPFLKDNFPEVEEFLRLRTKGDYLVRYEDHSYKEENIVFADSSLFDVFTFHFLAGEPSTALVGPNKLVITKAIAEKYFSDLDPIGKILILDNKEQMEVTAVIEDMPHNAHFNFNFFGSLYTLPEIKESPHWTSTNFHTYLLLRKGATADHINSQLPKIVKTHVGGEIEQLMGLTWNDFTASGSYAEMELGPAKDIYLHSHTGEELGPRGDLKNIYISALIGAFILIIACINFMNLSTARASSRAREVGIRKVVGAAKKQLVIQFLSESVIVAFISVAVAVGFILFALPYLNELAAKELSFNLWKNPLIIFSLLGIGLSIGLVSGSYPALFLSSFEPGTVLKGLIGSKAKKSGFRNTLVVIQFCITSGLLVGTFVIYHQLNYMQQKKLGYSRDHILILNDAYGLGEKVQTFKEEMSRQPSVINSTITSYLPTPSARNSSAYFRGNSSDNNAHVVEHWRVDESFIPTLDMEILKGRNFSKEFGTDTSAIIINERAAQVFDIQELGTHQLSNFQGGTSENPQPKPFHIIGIVKNFHISSLRDEIPPLLLHAGTSNGMIAFRVEADGMQSFISSLQNKWQEMAPNQPFSYTFLDKEYTNVYTSETRIGKLVGTFSLLAIFIACIGLFGLTSFSAQQRTREIGIRKVLGASNAGIVSLLSTDFLKLVVIAILIASPIAYYFMKNWLEGFTYHINISWWVFLATGLVAIVIAFLTLSFHSLKAAMSNPAESLRSE